MSQARKTYTRAFKLEALRLVDAGDKTVAQVQRALGQAGRRVSTHCAGLQCDARRRIGGSPLSASRTGWLAHARVSHQHHRMNCRMLSTQQSLISASHVGSSC